MPLSVELEISRVKRTGHKALVRVPSMELIRHQHVPELALEVERRGVQRAPLRRVCEGIEVDTVDELMADRRDVHDACLAVGRSLGGGE